MEGLQEPIVPLHEGCFRVPLHVMFGLGPVSTILKDNSWQHRLGLCEGTGGPKTPLGLVGIVMDGLDSIKICPVIWRRNLSFLGWPRIFSAQDGFLPSPGARSGLCFLQGWVRTETLWDKRLAPRSMSPFRSSSLRLDRTCGPEDRGREAGAWRFPPAWSDDPMSVSGAAECISTGVFLLRCPRCRPLSSPLDFRVRLFLVVLFLLVLFLCRHRALSKRLIYKNLCGSSVAVSYIL